MKMSKFAEKFEMDEDEMIEFLTDNGYLKKNGNPTKKGEDYLEDDENVTDSRGLQKIVGDILDDEDETDDDSDDSNEDDDEDSDEDEDNDDEDEEIDYETIKNTIEDFEFSKDEKVDLAKLLIDKLAEDTDADDDEDEEDSDEDDDEDEEDDDPNAPGTYKGWKISREGIKIIAKNGKKSLTTSVKGNIRKIIDAEMKKKK